VAYKELVKGMIRSVLTLLTLRATFGRLILSKGKMFEPSFSGSFLTPLLQYQLLL
jgi:hypothetical protein